MQPRDGFLHSNKTDPNDPKHHYWGQKVDWMRSFLFWAKTVHRFVNGPNRCLKCDPNMVFYTVTKLTQTNQNITIGSKKMDWGICFISRPKLCIVSLTARIGALNATPAWFFAQ